MTFQEAVKTCLNKYADFKGRARRPEYWWFVLFIWIGNVVFGLLDRLLLGAGNGLLGVIWGLAVLVPAIAVGVRRLHDLDKSGWWLLLGLIPIIGTIVLIWWFVQPGTKGKNQFGAEPRVKPRGL
ncbi:DUF805 domain-containing protein [Aliiruegeria lutimaris]|uniref:Uncharacterized membrane protein YhaH, DUF805 family n=1 Tax=Aliiruegeria lutimaris TaxID=571298 RepID=A0A1G9BRC3_9RHOB|nr:DUF805 domain-containing protein [Aliiruegeria lutimaris]SDK42051.1 Uncharacterized membrane protein YhaH, DUF805 family [Aliiruegeria lutimaris]